MNIYTSYFDNIKYIKALRPDIIFISISLFPPDWYLQLYKIEYKTLAPLYTHYIKWQKLFEKNILSKQSIEYFANDYYNIVLKDLSARKVVKSLGKISTNFDICLVSNEYNDIICHRSIIRKWLNDNGYECKEYPKSEYSNIVFAANFKNIAEKQADSKDAVNIKNKIENTITKQICNNFNLQLENIARNYNDDVQKYIKDFFNYNNIAISVNIADILKLINNLSICNDLHNKQILLNIDNIADYCKQISIDCNSALEELDVKLQILSTYCDNMYSFADKKFKDAVLSANSILDSNNLCISKVSEKYDDLSDSLNTKISKVSEKYDDLSDGLNIRYSNTSYQLSVIKANLISAANKTDLSISNLKTYTDNNMLCLSTMIIKIDDHLKYIDNLLEKMNNDINNIKNQINDQFIMIMSKIDSIESIIKS